MKSFHGYCFPHHYQHLETEPPLFSRHRSLTGHKQKKKLGSGPLVFIDIHWIIHPQLGSKLFEILFCCYGPKKHHSMYVCSEQDIIITAIKLMLSSCAEKVSFSASYIMFECSLKYLRFKILYVDLIIGPDISSLSLISENMLNYGVVPVNVAS